MTILTIQLILTCLSTEVNFASMIVVENLKLLDRF